MQTVSECSRCGKSYAWGEGFLSDTATHLTACWREKQGYRPKQMYMGKMDALELSMEKDGSRRLRDRDLDAALDAFLEGPKKIEWLEGDAMKVHARKSVRFGGPALDLATFRIYEERHRGKGLATSFIERAISRHGGRIFVENVSAAEWRDELKERHGFVDAPHHPECLWLE